MISVIVPVYNSAPYLQQCINSIQSQSYSNLEIICINDGSTDNSLALLQTISQNDPRVIVLSQVNSGVSAARNAGLDVATGEYISFIDSDDILEPDMYEVLVNLATEHQADICHCGYKKIFQNGTTKNVQGTEKLLVQNYMAATECLLTGKYFVGSLWNKLYKKELFTGIQFDTSLKINEDILMNVQVFQRANKVVFWDVPKYHYFERASSSCNRTNIVKKKVDCVSASEKILELYKNTQLEYICAGRMQGALIDLYRTYLFMDMKGTQDIRDTINNKICTLMPLCQNHSLRGTINYRFMRHLPNLYRIIYTVYDHIRKPNWDL